MKGLGVIIAFVAGATIAAIGCNLLNAAHAARRGTQLLSDVHDPLRQCLDDIAQTYDRGDPALAERKTRLLQNKWSQYLRSGGRAPEQFANEVIQLATPATRPATE